MSWKKHEAFARHEYLARWVKFLHVNGVEASHWLNCGVANAPDSEIMAYARENGYIVFTHDLDFSALLANSKDSKPSVIQLRAKDISPEAAGNAILSTLRQMQSELETGALLTIDPNRSRIRFLPLNFRKKLRIKTPLKFHVQQRIARYFEIFQICRYF